MIKVVGPADVGGADGVRGDEPVVVLRAWRRDRRSVAVTSWFRGEMRGRRDRGCTGDWYRRSC